MGCSWPAGTGTARMWIIRHLGRGREWDQHGTVAAAEGSLLPPQPIGWELGSDAAAAGADMLSSTSQQGPRGI